MHGLVAAVVGMLIVVAWNPGDWYEAIPWVLVTVTLLVAARGYWFRRRWIRGFTWIIHGPLFLLSLLTLPCCVIFLVVVPMKGIAVFHVFAIAGIFVSVAAGFLSGITLRYTNKRMFTGSPKEDGVPLD